MGNFIDLLKARWSDGHFLCVGLDTDYAKLPEEFRKYSIADAIFKFNQAIVRATAEYCCAFKPNAAFYEGYGLEGLEALIRTNEYIGENYPAIPVIFDAKRGDIGNTNQGYLKAAFDVFKAQAITLHPYLGKEALQPFLDAKDCGVFVLCHTSNPGAGEFQELKVDGRELYQVVAGKVSSQWNYNQNCGLVVGATYPKQLAEVRKIAGDIPILIPGIGAQGGDLVETVTNGLNEAGAGIIINASRSIIYASRESDFDRAAGREAAAMDEAIQKAVHRVGKN
jgi:orotidine-5'-phosphate decarboxylase